MERKLNFTDMEIFIKNSEVKEINAAEGIIISRADLTDDSIYYLDNPVSQRIWNLINGKNSLGQIKKMVLSEFEVNPKELNRDLKKFIRDLSVKNIIIYVTG